MATIGGITVPEPSPSGTFPLVPEWGFVAEQEPVVAVHQFLVAGAVGQKREQRFKLGDGLRRWTIRVDSLNITERDALVAFWEARKACYQPFTLNLPNDTGSATTAKTVRFADDTLTLEYVFEYLTGAGLTLVEVPTTTPSYTIAATVDRFPSGSFETALADQAQELIPLVTIVAKDSGVPTIYLSDRRVTIGAITYEPRLLKPPAIAQTMGAANDEAVFLFGNADRVMTDLVASTQLRRARMTYSLYHVQTQTLVHVWGGRLQSYAYDQGNVFRVDGSDPIYELTMQYPVGRLGRSCGKRFDDSVECPYSSVGSGGNPAFCDKTFAGTDGCTSHAMTSYFGGQFVNIQGANVKDNATGMFGKGRTSFTATSITNESNFGLALPEIYTDVDMEVPALIVQGREESDFYAALGVVGAGPLGAYSRDSVDLPKHQLDGQWNHGRESYNKDAAKYSQRFFGLRESLGPSPNTEPFGVANTTGPAPSERSAGTAFLEIRRTDPKGIQLSRPTEHEMKAWVSQGLSGWTWTNATTPAWAVLTNPIWICVNLVLRAQGYRYPSGTSGATVQATGAALFDLQSAVDAAALCDASVAALVGPGSEARWKFLGRIGEEKPLKDWLQEILNTCLGCYSFANGRMRFGMRSDSVAVNAFTSGNVLRDSISFRNSEPKFNEIVVQFANRELNWAGDVAIVRDETHAAEIGTTSAPLFLKSQMNLAGCATRSQAVRFGVIRLREELGGITAADWKNAGEVGFRSTVLALSTEPGQVVSITHEEIPGGVGEFRLLGWRLNDDYSIDFDARTTTDSMYDLASGTVGKDVEPAAIPGPPVIELQPGNVIAIGADAFTMSTPVAVADSQGVQRYQVDVTYNPPTNIGTFDGVIVYLERAGEIVELGDYRYDGDGTGTAPGRYGTARVLIDPPPGPGIETVYLYVVGRSVVHRLPVIPRADPAASPNRSLALAPLTPIGGTPPGDVTGLAARYEYIDTQRIRILIDYTDPSPLGDFVGVHCWQEDRDVSSTPTAELDGTTLLDGSTNLGGEWAPIDRGRFVASPVVLVVDAPRAALTTRIYLASFSEGAEAALVRATEASPTPSVTLAIAPATYQSGVEYAQNVTGAVATVEYDDSQVASPKYRIRFQWAPPAIAPATWQREFGGVQIVYEYDDSSRANGPALALNETDARSDWYDLYVGTSVIKCWFVAFDNSEEPRLNTIVGGVTPMSEATVVWPLAGRPAGAPYADNVTGFDVSNARYSTNGQGQKVLLIDWAWTRPVGADALARWGGAVIWLYLPGGERFQMTGAETAAAGSMEIGQFPASAQTWTFRAISQDNNNNPNTDAAAPHVSTPTDTIAVAPPALGATGTEYTANVTGASFAVAAVATSDGTTGQRVSGMFTRPADVTWGGAELRVYDGATVVGRVSGAGSPLAVTLPNPDSAKTYTVKLVSFDVNGQTNTETAGTPQGTVLVGSAVGTLDLRKFLGASVQDVEIGASGKIEVKALAITSTKIADGAISTPKLQANSVTANEIAAGAVVAAKVAANAIAALNIQAGVITSDKLDATVINVGGGGGKPGKFAIFNAAGSQIGFIGVESGNEGAWFKSLSIGGTGFASGKVKADASGAVTITDATFSLTLNGVVTEITNVFDSVDNAGLRVKRAASNNRVLIAPDDIYMIDNGGQVCLYATNNGTACLLGVRHNSSNRIFEADPQSGVVRTIAMDCEINGYINSTSEYRLNGIRVVSARKSGWSTPSGTATRSSFATSTVTLPELAERVKALIDDLHATAGHGLIGS